MYKQRIDLAALCQYMWTNSANQGSGDDAAASDANFRCSDGGELTDMGGIGWGSFTDWQVCPAGSAVCGIRVQLEVQQGSGGKRFLAHADNAAVHSYINMEKCP